MADIQIQAPDGSVVQFPSGTSDDIIKNAMAKTYGSAKPSESSEFKLPVRSLGNDANDIVRAAANGLTFGGADRVAAGMTALTGIGGGDRKLSDLITGQSSNDYSGNLERERARTDKFAAENPFSATAANLVGGAVLPLGAIGAASRAATLGGKVLAGAGAGGILGGAQGAIGSRDYTDLPQVLKDTAAGAGIGTALGGAIPIGGRMVGGVTEKIANALNGKVTGIPRSASGHLIDAINAEGLPSVQSRLSQLGPDAMLADAGPALLGKAQGASLNSDQGRSIMQNALKSRDVGTNARIAGDVERALGPAEDPQTVTDAIRAHRSAVDAVNYPAALKSAPDVDTGGLLANLGPMISQSVGMEKKALTNLRGMLMTEKQVPRLDPQTGHPMSDAKGNALYDTVPTPQTDPQILHKIKGEIDNVIQYDQPGLGIPAAALSRQQGALKHIRGELNVTLETQVPGYAEANAKSAALAKRGEAVDQGTQYLGSGKTTASPDRFASEFAAREPGEKIAFAKGSRGNIERVLGTKANDLQALRGELQGEGGWNTEKIGTVHGQAAADSLAGSVDRNLKFRDTYNKIVENSQTAQRTAAKDAMRPTPATETPIINPNMTIAGLVGTAGKKAIVAVQNAVSPDQTKSYGEIAKILSAQGGERDSAVLKIADALSRRQNNADIAPTVGNASAAIAAALANSYYRPNRIGSQ